eukprot:1154852-Pelagomonas_calceolata.AAC.4
MPRPFSPNTPCLLPPRPMPTLITIMGSGFTALCHRSQALLTAAAVACTHNTPPHCLQRPACPPSCITATTAAVQRHARSSIHAAAAAGSNKTHMAGFLAAALGCGVGVGGAGGGCVLWAAAKASVTWNHVLEQGSGLLTVAKQHVHQPAAHAPRWMGITLA